MENKKERFQSYFSQPIKEVINLDYIGNNRIYKIIMDDGTKRLIKEYSSIQIHKDPWNRGKTEFEALKFLWGECSLRSIPEPLFFDNKNNIGIYSFEEGKLPKENEINGEFMVSMGKFLAYLHNINNEHKKCFQTDRTATLNGQAYIDQLNERLETIEKNFTDEYSAGRGRIILNKVKDNVEEFTKKLKSSGYNLVYTLDMNEQALGRGDFAPHNILVKNENGNKKCTFLDFEWFGRDDPVKQVLDVLHHARLSNISKKIKGQFLKTYLENTDHPRNFHKRIILMDEAIGLQWVLIYLNVLSSKYLEHMKFNKEVGLKKEVLKRLNRAEEKMKDLSFFDK